MRFGIFSGILWGLDTVVLGIALLMGPFADAADASIASAFLHDAACALFLLIYMGVRHRLRDTLNALKTRSGRVVMLAALLGGPIGMTGYLVAINNIGAGPTAVISAFYPAMGSILAVVFLGERMHVRQVIALAFALLGVMVMGWSSSSGAVEGDALLGIAGALTCVIGWGSEAVILTWGMRDDAVDNETALQIRETTSALVYGLVVVPIAGAWSTCSAAFTAPSSGVVALAALSGMCSYLFYYRALNGIGAARGMALNISYSAWAVIFGIVLLGAVPTVLEVVCCVVIIVGTVLSATPDWLSLGIRKERA